MMKINCSKGSLSLFWFVLLLTGMLTLSSAHAVDEGWQDISDKVAIDLSNPIRSRRSPDAIVTVTITNTNTETLSGTARLLIKDLTSTVSIAGYQTAPSGEVIIPLDDHISSGITAGTSLPSITLTFLGGGKNLFSFNTAVEKEVTIQAVPLAVHITQPQSLTTVGASPVTVTGTINNPAALLTLNGVQVTHDSGQFSAAVVLKEGHNTIVARAVSGDELITDNISISFDLTPPYLTIESHTDGQDVYSDKVTITGLINDIVRGTIEEEQANVTVNGVVATISNRSYAVQNVSLTEGENTITVNGTDQVGNSSSISIKLNYIVPLGKKLELVSGQSQSSVIGEILTAPLKVKVLDDNLDVVKDTVVVFRVIQGAGAVAPDTDDEGRAVVTKTNEEGIASTNFKVGVRVGTDNHKVRAKVVGYSDEIIFTASAEGKIGNKISINSGNNQRGAVGQILPEAFVVVVNDDGANVVSGARVKFEVTRGEGKFANNEVLFETQTDSDGRATAEYRLGALEGLDAQRVTVTLIDAPSGESINAGFSATAFVPADPGLTTISGVVLDNQDNPIPGVTVRADGTTRQSVADAQGHFLITSAPVGPVHLIVDGSTAEVEGEFPSLSYNLVTISGVDNPLSSPVYMVKLDTDGGVYAGKEDVVLELEKFPGFKLEIVKDSVTFPDGSREGIISATPVNASKIPMAPPNGMQPQFIVTIQPTGTKFDPPARLTLPNVDGHAPGAQVEMYSFDHDLEEFVAIGLGTVSEDSTLVQSNIGVGVIKAGWHCGSQPGGSGCADSCPYCKDCDGNCNCKLVPSRLQEQQSPTDCKNILCDDSFTPADGETPDVTDTTGDCKKTVCSGGSPTDKDDDSDITPEDEKCSKCQNMNIVADTSKNDNKCGDGTLKQACLVCKDGKCDIPECKADLSKDQTLRVSSSTAGMVSFQNKAKSLLNKIPNINIESVSFEVRGETLLGERCCNDCTSSDPVSDYYRANAQGYLEVLAGVHYGPKVDFNKSIAYKGYGINAIVKGQAGITIGVGLNGAIGGSGEILSDCPELEGCVSLFGQANVSFRPKIGFTIKEIAANVLYSGKPKEVGSVSAQANAGARIGQTGIRASILMKGNNCPESCTYSLGGGTADIKIGIRISLLGFEILNPPDFTYVLVLWNGINGPC